MKFLRKLFCKHDEYFETMACDAICNKCHKNLGFIGNVRGTDKREVGEQRWW